MKKYLQLFLERAIGSYFKKINYLKTAADKFERMAEVATAIDAIY